MLTLIKNKINNWFEIKGIQLLDKCVEEASVSSHIWGIREIEGLR